MKKLMALLLAFVLLLGLVACGGDTTTSPDVLVGDTTEEPEAATPDDPVEEGEKWDGDYETATFDDVRKYGIGSTQWDGSLPLTTTGEKIEIGIPTGAVITDWETNTLTMFIKEKTGIDLILREAVGSSSDISTQYSLMFSGGEDMPDIICTKAESNQRLGDYVEAGYIQNVAGYYMTDAYYFKKALDTYCDGDAEMYATILNGINNYAVNQRTGQVYGPVRVVGNPTDLVHTETLVNTEWLNKLGLKAPTTVEELYNVLVAFRDKDPNGNGKKDEVPLMGLNTNSFGRSVDSYLINAFVQYSSERKAMIEDGVAFSVFHTDEYRQAMIFMNKLVKEGLLSELAFTAGGKDLQRLLNPVGNEPYTVGIVCANITGDFQNASNSLFVYEALPALGDATGRGGYSLFGAPQVRSRWSICWDCENVQLAFRMLDYFSSPEVWLHQRWGEEGVDWDWIENTEFKDQAKGNGAFGGDAVYVAYGSGLRPNTYWPDANTFSDERHFQVFVNPNNKTFSEEQQQRSIANVLMQESVGVPEEQFFVFVRTPEEDEIFQEFNSDLNSVIAKAKADFAMNRRDPNDDAEWNAYLNDLRKLKYERWAELAQISYDRQKAELEAIRAQMGK